MLKSLAALLLFLVAQTTSGVAQNREPPLWVMEELACQTKKGISIGLRTDDGRDSLSCGRRFPNIAEDSVPAEGKSGLWRRWTGDWFVFENYFSLDDFDGTQFIDPSVLLGSNGFFGSDFGGTYTIFRVHVPALTVKFIGAHPFSGKKWKLDRITIELSESIERVSGTDRYDIANVSMRDDASSKVFSPGLIVIPPSLNDRTVYLKATSHQRGQTFVYWRTSEFHVLAEAAKVAAVVTPLYLAECMLLGCKEPPSKTDHAISGAIQVAQSLLMRENRCAIVSDGVITQAQTALSRMFPDYRFVQRWGAAYIQEIFASATNTVCIDGVPPKWRAE